MYLNRQGVRNWNSLPGSTRGLGAACAVIMGILWTGCGHDNSSDGESAISEQMAVPAAVQSAEPNVNDIQDVIGLWTRGERDSAIASLLDLVAMPDSVMRCRLYHMTEAEFVEHASSDRDRLRDEMLKTQSSLRSIAREMMLRGEKNETHGLQDNAKKYFVAAKRLGEANRSPAVPLLIDLVGKAIEERADVAISRLDPIQSQTSP